MKSYQANTKSKKIHQKDAVTAVSRVEGERKWSDFLIIVPLVLSMLNIDSFSFTHLIELTVITFFFAFLVWKFL